MIETYRRRKRHRRLSIFTDLVILIILMMVFSLIMNLAKHNANMEFDEDALSLENIQDYDKNTILAEQIKNEFGVNIRYGEASREDAQRVSASIQLNEQIISDNLEAIYNVFKIYPKEYFKNSDISVIILDSFSNNNIALASRNNLQQYKIYISNASEYERALNHEMYHVFEYMMPESKRQEVTSKWLELNPKDFNYNSNVYQLNDKYVYCDGCNLDEAYFVTKYAKASNKEDRAEVFAEIMNFDVMSQEYFTKSVNPIYLKASFIIDVLNSIYKNNKTYKWNIFD